MGQGKLLSKNPFKKEDAPPRENKWTTSQFCAQYHFHRFRHIPNENGKGYTPKIFTDQKCTATQTDTDNDSETDQPHIPFLGDYCQTCISKWSRCTRKPPSDWDADPITITQPETPLKRQW